MKRLEVSLGPLRTRRATDEKPFEKEVVNAIHAVRGAKPEKTDFIPGWPDRYVGCGVWIEFKSCVLGRTCWPYNMIDLKQKTAARTLFGLGDNPHVCILWLDPDTAIEYVQFTPWLAFSQDTSKKWMKKAFLERDDVWTRAAFIPFIKLWATNVGTR